MDLWGNLLLPGGKVVQLALRHKLGVVTELESSPLVSLEGLSCGKTATGEVDIRTLTTLVFTKCDSPPPNAGERSIEKVFLYDSPARGDFQYRFDNEYLFD